MRTNSSYNAYSQNDVSVESPEKLIMMLYEGILKFTSQAKASVEINDIEKRTYWTNRASAIFIELINSLDYSAGDISLYLEGLYRRELELLTQANIENSVKPLDEVIHVTKELSEAWRENVIGLKNENMD